MFKVGIVGGTGYTGAELLRLLALHPQVEIAVLTSRRESGQRADVLFPHLRGLTDVVFSEPDDATLERCDAVFFATPHGSAMQSAPRLLAAGVRVIDLSADFRLRDPQEFERWYGMPHAAPELLAQAVYGLPEIHRGEIRAAALVGCPGCYPTAVQLGLLPLLEAGLAEPDSLIADCKSGVSGAGRELKPGSMYCEVADSMKAYGVVGHRHLPEIERGLSAAAGRSVQVTFVPHLVPLNRGIQASLYARVDDRRADLQAVYERRYAGEPFVDVLPAGSIPETRSVRGANVCRMAVHRPRDGGQVVVLAVIDNLVKGASGQAVQCMNLMLGLPECEGLEGGALVP